MVKGTHMRVTKKLLPKAALVGAVVATAALALAAADADLVALVKPQFEAGPAGVGRGGLVRDPEVRAAAEASVATFLDGAGWPVRAAADSPISGGDGNLERLIWATRA